MGQGQQAGYRAGRTVTHRNVLRSPDHVLFTHGMIDSANAYDGKNTGYEKELRPGTPMGQITATKLWVPCRRTTTTTTGTVTAAVLVDSRAFKVGDTISIGADTGITITAIDYGTDTITIASTTIAAGEAVVVADGSQTARCVLNEHVNLYTPDRVLVNKSFGKGIYHGLVSSAGILGDLAAIRANTNYLNLVQWDDYLGQL